MSIRKLLLLQDAQLALDETFSKVMHPPQPGMTKRKRIQLLVESLVDHLSASAAGAKRKGRRVARSIVVEAALLTSHELAMLADRIEQKAQAIGRGEQV